VLNHTLGHLLSFKMQFQDIPGRAIIKNQLISGVQNERTPHAMLFSGQQGSGLLPLALAFAQYVNCLEPSDSDSCGRCKSCMKSQKFIHPDIHYTFPIVGANMISTDFYQEWREALSVNPFMTEFEWLQALSADNKQGNITSKECSEIVKKTSLKPFEGKYKIFIIWQAERLKKEGNRLLKTIEEPPGNTIILMLTENQQQILPTIISRTQVYKIGRFADKDIKNWLIKKDFDKEEIEKAVMLANGNINEALKFVEGEVNDNEAIFEKWLTICYQQKVLLINEWVNDSVLQSREAQKNFIQYALHFFQQSMLMVLGGNQQPRLSENEKSLSIQLFSNASFDKFEKLNTLFNKAYFYAERNAHRKLLFFNLSVQLMRLLR